MVILDFEGGQICNLKPGELTQALAQGYRQIDANVGDRFIALYITVNGVVYPFKFDTGFTGSFTMPFKECIAF